jgi:hypothetical protein
MNRLRCGKPRRRRYALEFREHRRRQPSFSWSLGCSPPLDPLVVTSLEWQAEVEQVQVPDAEATGHAWMPGGIPGDLYGCFDRENGD